MSKTGVFTLSIRIEKNFLAVKEEFSQVRDYQNSRWDPDPDFIGTG